MACIQGGRKLGCDREGSKINENVYSEFEAALRIHKHCRS